MWRRCWCGSGFAESILPHMGLDLTRIRDHYLEENRRSFARTWVKPSTRSGKPVRGHYRQITGGDASGAGNAKPEAPAGKPTVQGKRLKTIQEAKRFLIETYGGWRDGLTPAEETAVRFYQSPGYVHVNETLRGRKATGKPEVQKRAKAAVKGLDAAIRKAPPLPEAVTVHRGFSAKQFADLKPGATIEDPAFVSTSLLPDVQAGGYGGTGGVTAQILLAKGTRAGAGTARELILPRGSRFRVIRVSGSGKKQTAELELIP